jgi:hypothetical protein
MPRRGKLRPQKNSQTTTKTAQLSLDAFLKPIEMAGDTTNQGGLALLLSAAEKTDRVSIDNLDARIDQETTLETSPKNFIDPFPLA